MAAKSRESRRLPTTMSERIIPRWSIPLWSKVNPMILKPIILKPAFSCRAAAERSAFFSPQPAG